MRPRADTPANRALDVQGGREDARRRGCMAEARRREGERVLALSPLDRALLALDLGSRLTAWARASR